MRAVTKRILALVLTLAMILSLGLTVQAVGSPVSIELNGTAMELTAPAYIDGQNRTQVPVTIGPQLGLTYQQKEGEVTFVKGEASLTFRDGSCRPVRQRGLCPLGISGPVFGDPGGLGRSQQDGLSDRQCRPDCGRHQQYSGLYGYDLLWSRTGFGGDHLPSRSRL